MTLRPPSNGAHFDNTPIDRVIALSQPATCSRYAALGPLDRTGVHLASWSGPVRSRVRRTGVAFSYTPFQESDALLMMFRFPWVVLPCIVVGTVGTFGSPLPDVAQGRSFKVAESWRRASGAACVLAPLTGTTARCQASTGTSVFRNTPQVETPSTHLLVQARAMDVCCFEEKQRHHHLLFLCRPRNCEGRCRQPRGSWLVCTCVSEKQRSHRHCRNRMRLGLDH